MERTERPWHFRVYFNWLFKPSHCYLLAFLITTAFARIGFTECINYHDYIRWTGSVDTPGDAQRVAISGSYAYVADWNGGLQVVDITKPDSPWFRPETC